MPHQRPHQRRDPPGAGHPAAGDAQPHRHTHRSAASTSSGSSARSARSRPSRTSRSSSRAAPTSTATWRRPRRRASTCSIAGRRCSRWRSCRSCSTSRPRPSWTCSARWTPARRPPPSCAARSSSTARASALAATRPPYYTDLTMHDLMVERFFTLRTVNNQMPEARRPHQDVPAAGDQGFAAILPRRAAADPRGHDRVLQPDPRGPSHQGEKDDLLAFLLAL